MGYGLHRHESRVRRKLNFTNESVFVFCYYVFYGFLHPGKNGCYNGGFFLKLRYQFYQVLVWSEHVGLLITEWKGCLCLNKDLSKSTQKKLTSNAGISPTINSES